MHPRQSWLALGLLTAFSVHAAVIYRWVDADGVVHYSDQQSPGAERIVTSAPNTAAAGSRNSAAAATSVRRPTGASINYSEFVITSPQAEQSFFGNQPISVHLDLSPSLKSGQSIVWRVNGRQLDDQADATAFNITGLDRGTYSVSATITDQQTGESQSSNSVTFYVRQPSSQSPQSPLRR